MRAPILNAWGEEVSKEAHDAFIENLAQAIVEQAAKDLADPRVEDGDYSTAVAFFEPSGLYRQLAEGLDLSEDFLQKCQDRINGREVMGVPILLW